MSGTDLGHPGTDRSGTDMPCAGTDLADAGTDLADAGTDLPNAGTDRRMPVLPPSRKVYRGLNGVELPREFWEKDEFGSVPLPYAPMPALRDVRC
eukprot:2393398-Rhodomonas_salina.2